MQLQQLLSSLHHHGDVVAAADGLVDFLGGVDLHAVDLHHDVSRMHAGSETGTSDQTAGDGSVIPFALHTQK